MIDGKFEYFAFISYKEEDAEWAKWLQRKLEHYKLPTALRKENPELPERVSPIYEYKSEAGGGRLKEVIWKGLTNSKYLIVICSPRATKSEWLNAGIHYFVDSGQEECIIPFIIDGKPKAENVDEECFPSTLRDLKDERELRGININEMGRDAAAVKVVSQMFNVKFDTLWQRYEREKKRKRLLILGALLLFALGCLAVGGYIVSQNVKLDEANKEIIQERDRANVERDKAENANASLRVANDSIRRQEERVLKINEELTKTNELLTIERDNVIKANIEINNSHGRIMAGFAHNLIDNGSLLLAQRLLLSQLSKSTEVIIPEIEMELRRVDVTLANGVVSLMDAGQPYAKDTDINMDVYIANNTNRLVLVMGHNLYMYNTQNGKLILNKYMPFDNIYDVEFGESEKDIVICGNNSKAYILDLITGEIVNVLEHKSREIQELSTDNLKQYIVSCAENKLYIWNWQGKLIDQYICEEFISSVSFSPDNKRIVFSSGNNGYLYNLNEKRLENYEFRHAEKVNKCNFSKDGRMILTCSNDSIVKIWDVGSGKLNHELVHDEKVYSGFFDSRNKNLVTLDSNNKIVVWNLLNHACRSIGYGYLGEREGSICALIPGNELQIINPFTQKIIVKIPISGALRAVDLSVKKRIAAIAPLSGTVKLWNLGTNKLYKVFAHNDYKKSVYGNNYMIRDFKWNKDGTKFVTAGYDRVAKIWEYPSFELFLELRGHTNGINTVCFDKTEKMVLTASCDSTMRLWDLNTRTEKFIKKYSDEVISASFINNNKYLMSISGSNIYISNAQDGNDINILSPIACDEEATSRDSFENEIINVVYVTNNHKIISSYRNGYIRIWNSETGILEKEIRVYNTQCYVALAPNELTFVTYSDDGLIKVWDARSLKIINSIKSEQVEMEDATIYIDNGNLIASATSEGFVNIWNVVDAKLIAKIDCNHGSIYSLRLSKNQKYLLAACSDHHFVVIDIEKHEQVMAYSDDKLYLCPEFNLFNDEIIVPLGDGLISCYPWKTINELIDTTKRRIGDNYEITPEEEKRANMFY